MRLTNTSISRCSNVASMSSSLAAKVIAKTKLLGWVQELEEFGALLSNSLAEDWRMELCFGVLHHIYPSLLQNFRRQPQTHTVLTEGQGLLHMDDSTQKAQIGSRGLLSPSNHSAVRWYWIWESIREKHSYPPRAWETGSWIQCLELWWIFIGVPDCWLQSIFLFISDLSMHDSVHWSLLWIEGSRSHRSWLWPTPGQLAQPHHQWVFVQGPSDSTLSVVDRGEHRCVKEQGTEVWPGH